jgi:hypothetical protein
MPERRAEQGCSNPREITMKRIDGAQAITPRVKLLPACLALALAVGSSIASPERAFATASPVAHSPIPVPASALPIQRAPWSDADRQSLVAFMQGKQRAAQPVPAASIAVTNCNDSGPGSYRQAVADALTGDTIDLTNTGCSVITLTTGDVITAVDDLTLQGPGALALTISGGYTYRPIEHIGAGTLAINDVSIADGKKYLADGGFGNASGGCVASGQGTVAINNSWIKYCDAGTSSTTTAVRGGAVFGYAGVSIINSVISGSTAHTSALGAYGGGVYTTGSLTVAYSTIRGNTATGGRSTGGGVQVGRSGGVQGGQTFFKYSTIGDNSAAVGGGVYSTGDAFFTNTTISGNVGQNTSGVLLFNTGGATSSWKMNNSTVSGNTSTFRGGGVYVRGNDAQIQNSTIAFNTLSNNGSGAGKYGAGLAVMSVNNVDLESVLISNNKTDLNDGNGLLIDDAGGVTNSTLSGASNLVYFPSTIVTPGGTILLTDPMLKALSSNGGSTATHSMSPLSPAINFGNNVLGAATDQRGSGFPRTLNGQTDIGAFEFDLSDVIFADGFDG